MRYPQFRRQLAAEVSRKSGASERNTGLCGNIVMHLTIAGYFIVKKGPLLNANCFFWDAFNLVWYGVVWFMTLPIASDTPSGIRFLRHLELSRCLRHDLQMVRNH